MTICRIKKYFALNIIGSSFKLIYLHEYIEYECSYHHTPHARVYGFVSSEIENGNISLVPL